MNAERQVVRLCKISIAICLGYYLVIIVLGVVSLFLSKLTVLTGICVQTHGSMIGLSSLQCGAGIVGRIILFVLQLPMNMIIWPGYIGFDPVLQSLNTTAITIFHVTLVGITGLSLFLLVFYAFVKVLLLMIRRERNGSSRI